MDSTKVVTVSCVCRDPPTSVNHYYYRLSLYVFIGDPPKAQFLKDLGFGFYDYHQAEEKAREEARFLHTLFIPGIEMMDSIEKVFKHILT